MPKATRAFDPRRFKAKHTVRDSDSDSDDSAELDSATASSIATNDSAVCPSTSPPPRPPPAAAAAAGPPCRDDPLLPAVADDAVANEDAVVDTCHLAPERKDDRENDSLEKKTAEASGDENPRLAGEECEEDEAPRAPEEPPVGPVDPFDGTVSTATTNASFEAPERPRQPESIEPSPTVEPVEKDAASPASGAVVRVSSTEPAATLVEEEEDHRPQPPRESTGPRHSTAVTLVSVSDTTDQGEDYRGDLASSPEHPTSAKHPTSSRMTTGGDGDSPREEQTNLERNSNEGSPRTVLEDDEDTGRNTLLEEREQQLSDTPPPRTRGAEIICHTAVDHDTLQVQEGKPASAKGSTTPREPASSKRRSGGGIFDRLYVSGVAHMRRAKERDQNAEAEMVRRVLEAEQQHLTFAPAINAGHMYVAQACYRTRTTHAQDKRWQERERKKQEELREQKEDASIAPTIRRPLEEIDRTVARLTKRRKSTAASGSEQPRDDNGTLPPRRSREDEARAMQRLARPRPAAVPPILPFRPKTNQSSTATTPRGRFTDPAVQSAAVSRLYEGRPSVSGEPREEGDEAPTPEDRQDRLTRTR